MKAIVATSLLAFFGLKEAYACAIEKNVDYFGNDLNAGGRFGRIKGHLPNAEACHQACAETPGCRSWTFVKSEPAGRDNCAVKKTTRQQGNRKQNVGCCDSGELCEVRGKWAEHKRSQCYGLESEVEAHARRNPKDGNRIDNPIFNGGGFIGTLTLEECAVRCEEKEGCVGFEWSNNNGLAAPATAKANCALAWACSRVEAWSGGNAYMRGEVDCKWKTWGGWSTCSHTCGSKGTQYRHRSFYPAKYGGRACSGPREYLGCYVNSGADRVNGHKWHLTFEECEAKAGGSGVFGMEYPQGSNEAGRAQCLLLPGGLPSMRRVGDAECETEKDGRGRRLGGSSRLAVYRGANVESRPCNRNIKCPITKIECSDFEIPNEAELPQFCTDVFVDVITVDSMSTGATKGMVTYKRGTEEQMTRSTTSGFSSEFGWDFSKADREWDSVTDSTEILIKDPSVSIGFKAGEKEFSASHSCFNKNSVQCTARSALGVGSMSVGAFFTSGGANILGGLMDKMAKLGSSGKEDPDKCKCKETKTTVSKEKGSEHTTTVGRMMRQGRTMEQTFESSKMEHSSQEYTLECPPWSECAYATYSVTSICAIPYWGTCKATRSDGRIDNFTIERDDTKNLYYTKQTQPRTYSFSGVTEITTDGSICGVMLTPAIDIPEHRHVSTCPKPNEISTLPNCDCMLPEYNDCGTPDGTLKNGQWCLLNVREGVTDNEICVRSKPHWRNVSSCFSRDVFVVSDYNHPVYQRLKAAIQLGDARPKYYKYTLRGDTGTEVVKVNGAEYVLGKSERAFQNEGPTVEIEFTNDGQARGEDRNVFLKRTEGSFTLVPAGGSLLRGYNGWNCGTENENKRCAAVRGGGMYWSGAYKATLSGGASRGPDRDGSSILA